MKLKFLTGGLLLVTCMARGQSRVSTQGGTCHLGDVTMHWTIGESVVSTIQVPDVVLTQGFDQHDQQIISLPVTLTEEEVTVEIFPNPVASILTITVVDFNQETSYKLLTIDGKPMLSGEFKATKHAIDFSNYASGAYMLTVRQLNQPVKTFKIIKN
jgi:hypothetical protein